MRIYSASTTPGDRNYTRRSAAGLVVEHTTKASSSQEMDATAEAGCGEGARHGHGGKDDRPEKKVPLLGMFRYADCLDMLLMVVGSLGAVGNGVSEPLMSVLFGDVINSFGESTTSTVLRAVTKVVLNFIYLGIGTAVASFLQVACWTMAGERQSARIRSLYLKSVLRQDIAFFDTEMTTGEAVSRMSSNTVIIQDALGEKAGKLVQLASAFFGGFIIAFTKGWLLTLVMLTSLPLIAIAGAVSAQLLTRVSSKRLTSYSDDLWRLGPPAVDVAMHPAAQVAVRSAARGAPAG